MEGMIKMKKVIKFIRSNILGLLVGLSLCLNGVIIAENMITSEQVSYSNDKTSETTVKGNLDELFSAVDINERLGDTDISSIGEDGTITSAIDKLNRISFKIRDAISAYSDFDQIIENGFYSVNLWVGSGGASFPSISNSDKMGYMIVFFNGSFGSQLYLSTDGTIRYRGYLEGEWTEWTTK